MKKQKKESVFHSGDCYITNHLAYEQKTKNLNALFTCPEGEGETTFRVCPTLAHSFQNESAQACYTSASGDELPIRMRYMPEPAQIQGLHLSKCA